MKNRFLCILFSAAAFLAGCDSEKGRVDKEEIRDIVLEGAAFSLSGYDFYENEILDGNGEYRIIYPKKILYFDENWHGGVVSDEHYVEYSEEYLRIYIVERKGKSFVRAERTLPEDQEACGHFMLTDGKGMKRLLAAGDLLIGWLFDWDEFEEKMINDPDYWQLD